MRVLTAIALVTSLAACSDSPDRPTSSSTSTSSSSSSSSSSGSGGAGGMSPVAWTACPLHSEGDGPPAECATLDMPLDPEAPTGKTIPFFVKRYRAAGGTGKTALWMLQGGPGGSGYVFERLAEIIATKFPDVDYYMPDHRGTGRSSKLTCTAQDAASPSGLAIEPGEWPACISEVKAQWGADLGAFRTTNAAYDLGTAVERTREPGQTVAIYGVSYGTYWATRALQLFPQSFDRVILDSFAPPGASLARQDQDADEAARILLKSCGTNAVCAAKLGSDPVAFTDSLFAKLKTGHCGTLKVPDGAGGLPLHAAFRLAFGSLLMQYQYRSIIFPTLYRLDRCNASDVTALQFFLDAVYANGPDLATNPFYSQFGFVLSNNIVYSEMWESPSPTAAELAAIRESSIATREITVDMAQEHDIWPLYSPDSYVGKWPDSSTTPVLVLAGEFDPATLTRKADVAKQHFQGPGRHYVFVPGATHVVITSSPTNAKRSCGTRMMMSFIDTPDAPDMTCLSDLVPAPFEPDASLSQGLFGTSTPWD